MGTDQRIVPNDRHTTCQLTLFTFWIAVTKSYPGLLAERKYYRIVDGKPWWIASAVIVQAFHSVKAH